MNQPPLCFTVPTIPDRRGNSSIDSLCSVCFRAHGLGIEVAEAHVDSKVIYGRANINGRLITDHLGCSQSCIREIS